jgi:hypothetical protein
MLLKGENAMSKRVTFCAMVVAISIVCLYLTSVLSTLKLSLLAVSSLILALAVIKYGVKSAVACFAATAILSIFIPDKLVSGSYALFFGSYVLIKGLIEKSGNMLVEWILKLSVFSVVMFVVLSFLPIKYEMAKSYIILIFAVFLIFYDIALSFFISALKYKLNKFLR